MFATTSKYQKLPEPEQNNLSPRYDDNISHHAESILMSDFSSKAPSLRQTYSPVPTETSLLGHSRPDVVLVPSYTGFQRKRLTGWRWGAFLSAITAACVLIMNASTALWAIKVYGAATLIEIYNGDCGRVEKYNTWVHLGINALSTALLSGSNYCMQCLSAPSREEIEKAHASKRWLDIGVPSVRNLRSISWKKVILWSLLGVSSIPLHLLYNSAFFSSLATNDYNVAYVTENFFTGAEFNNNATGIQGGWAPDGWALKPFQEDVKNWTRLENAGCINLYTQDFLFNQRTLIIVADNATVPGGGSLLGRAHYEFQQPSNGYDPFEWICQDTASYTAKVAAEAETSGDFFCYMYISQMMADSENWRPNNFNAQYCMSEPVPGTCGFNINLIIMLIVIIANVGKLVGMAWVTYGDLQDPLITVGDAISSFLTRPEKSTEGICTATKRDVVESEERAMKNRDRWVIAPGPKEWMFAKNRLFGAASKARWWTCLALFATALLIVGILLGVAIGSIQGGKSFDDLKSLGFGQVSGQTLITGWSLENIENENNRLTANILIANLPQTILSFLYLTLNGLLTSMFLAVEWSGFAHERKGLRVSIPRGSQRKTYFLQLPYKIALPLLVMSGLLHWLVSQSIFLAVVAEYDEVGNLVDPIAVATCGFSPIAMMCVLVAGGCIIIFATSLGAKKFKPGMPLVGSCSAAIAAACHAPVWDTDAALKPVQWGVLPDLSFEDGTEHCCFSSEEVILPVAGQKYAGLQDRTNR